MSLWSPEFARLGAVLFGALSFVLPRVPVLAQTVPPVTLTMETSEDSDHSYRSVGEMTLPFEARRVASLMEDWAAYNRWAPRGQDGSDPQSAKYIGQLTGARPGPGYLDLVYRVNLFWPLGSSGQTLRLWISFPPSPESVTRIHFVLKDTSLALLLLEGDFSLVPVGEGSRVIFDSRLKLAWFLRPFFPLEGYRTHVVHRIETALRSFAREVASQTEDRSSGSSSQSPGPDSSSPQSSKR